METVARLSGRADERAQERSMRLWRDSMHALTAPGARGPSLPSIGKQERRQLHRVHLRAGRYIAWPNRLTAGTEECKHEIEHENVPGRDSVGSGRRYVAGVSRDGE